MANGDDDDAGGDDDDDAGAWLDGLGCCDSNQPWSRTDRTRAWAGRARARSAVHGLVTCGNKEYVLLVVVVVVCCSC